MNLKLFGYSISLNVLILIGILYLIMVVNALSSSCNREGMTSAEAAALQQQHYMLLGIERAITQPLSTADYQRYKDQAYAISLTTPDSGIKSRATIAINTIDMYLKQAKEAEERAKFQKAQDDLKIEADRLKTIEDQKIKDQKIIDDKRIEDARIAAVRPSEPQRDRKRRWR